MARRTRSKRRRKTGQFRRRQERPAPAKRRSVWKRIPAWIWVALAFLSIVVAMLQAYPWLSIQETISLDPSNPYSELFLLVNEGYLPVTNLDADCGFSFEASPRINIQRNIAEFPNFARFVPHSGMVTLPCFRTVTGTWQFTSAQLNVTATYSYYGIPWQLFRRHQTFLFRAVKASDGSLHWTYVR